MNNDWIWLMLIFLSLQFGNLFEDNRQRAILKEVREIKQELRRE